MNRPTLITLITAVTFVALASVLGQDAGELVHRDDAGLETKITTVVTSQQIATVIEALDRLETGLIEANAKLDALGDPAVVEPVGIYINTATYDELLSVSGIGKTKAGAIIAERGTPGFPGYSPFSSWTDLALRVNGVGGGTVADMQADGVLLDESSE